MNSLEFNFSDIKLKVLSIKKKMLTQTYASLSLMAGSNKVIMHIKPKNIPLLKEINFHY